MSKPQKTKTAKASSTIPRTKTGQFAKKQAKQKATPHLKSKKPPKILSIDIGGTHVKMLLSGLDAAQARRFDSGPTLTPAQMVEQVLALSQDWEYQAISMGYPGPVLHGQPVREPANLGKGWVGFDFARAFGKPLKIVNDAAMQALGDYQGGKLLFLGLGTGLGTALIVDGIVEPLELAHLPYRKKTFEDYVGLRGLKKYGKKKWRGYVLEVVADLTNALQADSVVLGGGNAQLFAKHPDELPQNVKLGANSNAFVGGFRLWNDVVNARPVADRD